MSDTRSAGKPFDIPKALVWNAYQKVKANKGAAGVDGQSLAEFAQDEKDNLYKLWNRLSSGSYFPPPVRAVEIPKRGGGVRTLGVPCVADRIAQTAVAMVLSPGAEAVFHQDSYGYRPGRSALDAVESCKQRCWRHPWVIDLDIQGFFDNVPHDPILAAVSRHTDLPWVLLYVKRWLIAPVQQADARLPGWSGELPKVPRSRHCCRICSCTTLSIPGWIESARQSGSSGTVTMPWCTAPARNRRYSSVTPSSEGYGSSASTCIRTRRRSCVCRARKRERPGCR